MRKFTLPERRKIANIGQPIATSTMIDTAVIRIS